MRWEGGKIGLGGSEPGSIVCMLHISDCSTATHGSQVSGSQLT